jgi:hypothetical protein
MAELKSILVRSGQQVELSEKAIVGLGGERLLLRPQTPAALKTLVGAAAKKPARLHDEQSFERLTSPGNLLELAPDKDGRFRGLSVSTLRAIVRVLPAESAMPKTVELPRVNRDCGCKVSRKNRASSVYFSAAEPYELALPEWLRLLAIFRVAAFFRDIVVEKGGLLVITFPIIVARNFVLHTGGTVKLQVSAVMDFSGAFRAGAAAS